MVPNPVKTATAFPAALELLAGAEVLALELAGVELPLPEDDDAVLEEAGEVRELEPLALLAPLAAEEPAAAAEETMEATLEAPETKKKNTE